MRIHEINIDIALKKPIIPPKAPPIVVRQMTPVLGRKDPIVIREMPPKIPPPAPAKIIKILPPIVPPPPRKLIVEKMPPIDDAPPIIIERWLAPKQQPRRVVFDGVINAQQFKHEPVTNEIIEYEAPKMALSREIKDVGVVRMDPNEVCVLLIF